MYCIGLDWIVNQQNNKAVDLLFRGVRPIHTRRKRNFNLNDNLLDGLSEAEVKSGYRSSRDWIQFITDTLPPDLERPTERNHALKPQEQVLVALRKGKQSRLFLPVSNPFKPLKDDVSFNNSKILSVVGDGGFGGGPPPVSLCSLWNFDSSFFAVLSRFVHFSLTLATLRCVVSTAFTAIVTSSHTLRLNLLVVVLINFDFSTACFSSNFWVIVAVSCTEKFGFRFLQAF